MITQNLFNLNRNDGRLLAVVILLAFTVSSCAVRELGGAFQYQPEELLEAASPGAHRLLDQAFEGLNAERLVDYHVHILGLGTDNSGAFVNPKMQKWWRLQDRLKFKIYTSASGIENIENADQEYVSRLVRLIRNIRNHGKYRIFAFDKYYDPDGKVNLEKTAFYLPNETVFRLSEEYPDALMPVISVHPYRPDAVEELEKWAKRGARFVKWLPNAMGIDPSSALVDRFYRKMKEYDMVLLSHTGEELAVDVAEEDQRLGNPLLLRKPLDYGLRVIMAHSASLGVCVDHDNTEKEVRPCFDLFLRLMDDKKYEGLLFGEISAMTQFDRMPVPFSILLERQDLHRRLVNGSDYPLPAINLVIRTSELVESGFITQEERQYLNEIYDYNPLLFDFVVKRTMRHPETGQKLSPSIFMSNPGLED